MFYILEVDLEAREEGVEVEHVEEMEKRVAQ
jgi:hypothetical protein